MQYLQCVPLYSPSFVISAELEKAAEVVLSASFETNITYVAFISGQQNNTGGIQRTHTVYIYVNI